MSAKRIQYDHSGCGHTNRYELDRCGKRARRGDITLPVRVYKSKAIVTVTERRCSGCRIVKPAADFHRNAYRRDGLAVRCRDCCAEYQRTNARRKSYIRNWDSQRNYGVTAAQVDAMTEARGGRCDICSVVPDRPLHVEHCHDGLHVRGLACLADNLLLGAWESIRDTPGVAERIAAHLDPANHVARRPESESDGSRTFRKYGISEADWDAILERQGHTCNICGTDEPGGRGGWHHDHAHDETEAVRGALCNRCNGQLLPAWERLLSLDIEPESALNEYLARGPVEIPDVEEPAYVPLKPSPKPGPRPERSGPRPAGPHADCDHPATKSARARCRARRQREALSASVSA
ncbi:endonuclease domain-containing protein [Rhodococcus pyridinivorans]|uniref:endonuclease domain-containing protein n=1 Tax=Rhodococcus pyridinivorans TaxID=103816 RepID=UPI003AAAF4C0